jgi:hypothetical protein
VLTKTETHRRQVLGSVLALFTVAALLGACGGDDKKDEAKASTTTTTEAADDTTTTAAAGDDVCSLLELSDLTDVTGITFDKAEPDTNACTYTSTEGQAAIRLDVTDITGKAAEQALTDAAAKCDEGSVKEIAFDNADGGFSCVVGSIPVVAATGEGAFAVLTAEAPGEVPTDQIIADLTTILQNAING